MHSVLHLIAPHPASAPQGCVLRGSQDTIFFLVAILNWSLDLPRVFHHKIHLQSLLVPQYHSYKWSVWWTHESLGHVVWAVNSAPSGDKWQLLWDEKWGDSQEGKRGNFKGWSHTLDLAEYQWERMEIVCAFPEAGGCLWILNGLKLSVTLICTSQETSGFGGRESEPSPQCSFMHVQLGSRHSLADRLCRSDFGAVWWKSFTCLS